MTTESQSNVIQPLLTDLYQISMAYAYWKNDKHEQEATFDLFFRKNPFGGEYTLFAGLDECLKFVRNYKFSTCDIDYLRSILTGNVETEFFDYLTSLNMNNVKIYAIAEGSIIFPRIPLLRVEGPVLKCQLLETTLLALVNFSSLVATNAARFRAAMKGKKTFHELGLRRAQGPDGGLSASKYCYLGGFDGSSNVLAGKMYGIPIKGTHAHAYVSSYTSLDELKIRNLNDRETGEVQPFADMALKYLEELGPILNIVPTETNPGELAAFISYAVTFPDEFLALLDTYDTLRSGFPNFLAVALALDRCHYQAKGLRLDSGDLAYLSIEIRQQLKLAAQHFKLPYIADFNIVASNDINEDTLLSLEKQSHEIDTFGIGTHLVTCQKQPALGCVYKLVELNGIPRIKLSQDIAKVTIPGRKNVYRLFGQDGTPLCDLMTLIDEKAPEAGHRVLCQHPTLEKKRAHVTPTSVQTMYQLYWADGQIQRPLPTLEEMRSYAQQQIAMLRPDHMRALNPTPYKVSVTTGLALFMHELWIKYVPVGELR